VAVIHNAAHLPPRLRADGAVRAELGIPPRAPVVGSLGRLAEMKRFDRLIEAVGMLGPEVRLVLAGDGPQGAELAARADALGMGDRVHLLGWRRDTADVLAAMDVYAVTSDREGMSNAMLEALASGLPVVSTPVSGSEDALAPFDPGAAHGIVTAGFGAAEVAAALGAVLADPVRRAGMSAVARHAAAERFSPARMLDRWEAVLSGVTEDPGVGPPPPVRAGELVST
jgi:glycosyltransferase involved in cell wall biosynthesis